MRRLLRTMLNAINKLTRPVSPKIVRNRHRWFAAIGVFAAGAATVASGLTPAAGIAATVASGLTPANGGLVGGTTAVVDVGPFDQTDPHVSGDLAAYTDVSAASIRYFSFPSNTSTAIPPRPATPTRSLT